MSEAGGWGSRVLACVSLSRSRLRPGAGRPPVAGVTAVQPALAAGLRALLAGGVQPGLRAHRHH